MRLLAAAAGGARRVRDLRRPLLRHALLLQLLVLLLVFDAWSLSRHGLTVPDRPCFTRAQALSPSTASRPRRSLSCSSFSRSGSAFASSARSSRALGRSRSSS